MSFKSGHLRQSNDVVSILNMAAAAAQYYFRFRICWRHCLQKVKIYPRAKFDWSDSIRGWCIVYLLPSVKNQRPQYCSALPVITLYRRYNVITGSAEQSRPRRLWRSFDELLDRGRAHLSSDIDASTLHRFFDDKVDGVRASTAGADSPTFTTTPVRFWCNLAVWWSMPSMVMWSNSKPEVEFQYGGRFVFRNRK